MPTRCAGFGRAGRLPAKTRVLVFSKINFMSLLVPIYCLAKEKKGRSWSADVLTYANLLARCNRSIQVAWGGKRSRAECGAFNRAGNLCKKSCRRVAAAARSHCRCDAPDTRRGGRTQATLWSGRHQRGGLRTALPGVEPRRRPGACPRSRRREGAGSGNVAVGRRAERRRDSQLRTRAARKRAHPPPMHRRRAESIDLRMHLAVPRSRRRRRRE